MKDGPDQRWTTSGPLESIGHAVRGLKEALRIEKNLQIHCLVAVLVVAVGARLGLSAWQWLWCALAIALVMLTELINTAVESVVNLCAPEEHPLARRAKDVAAAAVLVSCMFALAVGVVVFGSCLTWRRSLFV